MSCGVANRVDHSFEPTPDAPQKVSSSSKVGETEVEPGNGNDIRPAPIGIGASTMTEIQIVVRILLSFQKIRIKAIRFCCKNKKKYKMRAQSAELPVDVERPGCRCTMNSKR